MLRNVCKKKNDNKVSKMHVGGQNCYRSCDVNRNHFDIFFVLRNLY